MRTMQRSGPGVLAPLPSTPGGQDPAPLVLAFLFLFLGADPIIILPFIILKTLSMGAAKA